MRNRYKETNFASHPRIDFEDTGEFDVYSDNLYDQNRLITHGFVEELNPDGTTMKRLVTDVEIAMSSAPSIQAVVSPEFQNNLRLGLTSQPRSNQSGSGLSDDELANSVMPVSLEHDEAAYYAKHILDSLPKDSPKPDSVPVPSVDSPQDSPASSE